MLLDTGADVSCVPRWAAKALDVQPAADVRFEVLSFEGTRGFAEAVALEMLFLGRRFRGQYLLVDSPSGIIGRNVLNVIPLVLDGPRLEWAEAKPAS